MTSRLIPIVLIGSCFLGSGGAAADPSVAMYEAIVRDDPEAVTSLIASGMDPNAEIVIPASVPALSGRHFLPLQLAMQTGRDRTSVALIRAGADPEQLAAALNGVPAVEIAAELGLVQTMRTLLERHPYPHAALSIAAGQGDLDIVEVILAQARPDGSSWQGMLDHALGLAAFDGQEDVARRLVAAGGRYAAPGVLQAIVHGGNQGLLRQALADVADPNDMQLGQNTVDIAVRRLEKQGDSASRNMLRMLLMAGAEVCHVAPAYGGYAAPTRLELRLGAPQCDWPD